ncbi:MAG: hypothetical protein F6K41_21905 [Symploca sp. SIO3E6]|nr:hypothetical protein [Caldora sp. SIO3E6]
MAGSETRLERISAALPYFAGVVDLMLEANPNLTHTQVRQINRFCDRSCLKLGALDFRGE